MSRVTFRAVGYCDEWLVNPRVHFTGTPITDDDDRVIDDNNEKQPSSNRIFTTVYSCNQASSIY